MKRPIVSDKGRARDNGPAAIDEELFVRAGGEAENDTLVEADEQRSESATSTQWSDVPSAEWLDLRHGGVITAEPL